MPMDVADLHRRTMAEFVKRVEGVGDRWDAPTPCQDWDVRTLVNHVVYEDVWTVPMMEGATVEEVGDRFEGDLLGDDPVAAARAAADAATIAAASGLVAGRTVHLSFGDAPAEEYAYQLAADHLVHGWDLAAATDGDRRFDPDLVEALAAWFADREDAYRSAGMIAERPPGDEPEDPQDRLIAAFGRRPDWPG
ncbi:MAG TPA: TIGR03086 family metal-binding protein [Acidimicrobiales bacterium]|jgi:uncharacterized protein (TIGR03086 family)|nr:TIGR03086 family metal-binding protein [Acidimicrobiales bacterium]